MSPNELCREYEIDGVPELSELTGIIERTLFNWANNKPRMFKIAVLGAQSYKDLKLRGLVE